MVVRHEDTNDSSPGVGVTDARGVQQGESGCGGRDWRLDEHASG